MPADLILLAIAFLIGLVLSAVVVRWDHRQLDQRRHRALRSFYERE
jgi:hypothetical protein